MKINANFTQPVLVDAQQLDWIASPAAGVDRRMLFRIGDEVARATSIVRYAPGSQFPRHVHGGGPLCDAGDTKTWLAVFFDECGSGTDHACARRAAVAAAPSWIDVRT